DPGLPAAFAGKVAYDGPPRRDPKTRLTYRKNVTTFEPACSADTVNQGWNRGTPRGYRRPVARVHERGSWQTCPTCVVLCIAPDPAHPRRPTAPLELVYRRIAEVGEPRHCARPVCSPGAIPSKHGRGPYLRLACALQRGDKRDVFQS